MNWKTRYLPPNPALWQGRADIPPDSCFYQHIRLLDLLKQKPNKSADKTFALLGFQCDTGIQRDGGRTGADEGPTAIRQSLAQLPIQNTRIHCYDAGDITCIDQDLENSQQALVDVVAPLLRLDICPMLLGGGHEIAFAHYQSIAKTFPSQMNLGIINFDAHFDMQPLQAPALGRSSSSFLQIAELHRAQNRRLDYNCIGIQHAGDIRQAFETAKQFDSRFILADDLHQGLQEKCFDFVDRIIDENDLLYVSLALDVFSPAFAPGVSTTQPLGLTPWQVIPLLRQLAASGKVIAYDIAECSPRYDVDHRTAKLAATLVYEIIHHHNEHNQI